MQNIVLTYLNEQYSITLEIFKASILYKRQFYIHI